MNTDFKNVMSKKTDEELIKIITIDKDDYQSSAIEAAEEEVKKRNIDTKTIGQINNYWKSKIEEQEKLDFKKVSSSIRFINFIIDTVIWLIIVFILTFPLNATIESEMLIGYLILIGTFLCYYSILETKYQKTIGKFITKTSVVNSDGTKPEFGDILRRTFCRLIPFDRLSFLFSSNGFHDRLSNTTIIRDEIQ
jgi:uncharacterized RDD family membrane protein YckC